MMAAASAPATDYVKTVPYLLARYKYKQTRHTQVKRLVYIFVRGILT